MSLVACHLYSELSGVDGLMLADWPDVLCNINHLYFLVRVQCDLVVMQKGCLPNVEATVGDENRKLRNTMHLRLH